MHSQLDIGWHEAVGRLVHQAALTESSIVELARQLSGLDEVATHQLLPIEIDHLIRVIRNLLPLRIHDVRLVNEVLAWTHQVRKLYAVRTSVVHTVWARATAEDTMVPIWSSAEVSEGTITVDDLERTRSRLAHLGAGPFADMMGQIRAASQTMNATPGSASET